jgi:hypothetical protein
MRKQIATVGSVAGLLAAALLNPCLAKDPATARDPAIQIAILLDTSNSMDGLISQAKTQLWRVVNEFVKAKRNGRSPQLEVALLEYGNNSVTPQEGFVRLVLPLTDDLDKVSERLFALSTNGGEEYCGKVISDAVAQLAWSNAHGTYKAIFIAGNEPFSQGPVNFRDACRSAVGHGIIVNTIFCGPNAEGERTSWKDGAVLADGQYMSIDQNQQVVNIPAPQDTAIVHLNADLNSTYIPYGKAGIAGQQRQVAQDSNAQQTSASVLAARANAKCSAFYCPSDWDLVDAIKTGKCTLESVHESDLPEQLRSKSRMERKTYIEEMARKRQSIQDKIVKLNAEREKFIAAEWAKRNKSEQETLDTAIIKAVREQVSSLNFTFE